MLKLTGHKKIAEIMFTTVVLAIGNTNGVKSIAKDFKDLGKNIKQIGSGLRNNIITKSIENSFKDSETSLIQAVKDYIRDDGKIAEIQKNKKLTAEQNGLTNLNSDEVRASLNKVAEILNDGNNFNNLEISDVNGNIAGLSYTDNNGKQQTITINLADKNIDLAKPETLINIIAHETTNSARHGTITDANGNKTSHEQTAINRGDTAEGIWGLKNFGNQNTNQMSGADWLNQNRNSQVIQQGNQALYNNLNNASQGNGSVAFSAHFDYNGKITFINDGDYRAYRTNEDCTLNFSKENIIDYAEGFNLNIEKGKENEFETQMKTDEVQIDLMRLSLLNPDLSITSNMQNMLGGTLNSDVRWLDNFYLMTNKGTDISIALKNDRLDNALNTNQRDALLTGLYANNLWNTLATYNDYSQGSINPSREMGDAFSLTINKGTANFYSSILDGEGRGSTGCGSDNCGDVGAGREKGARPHYGTDILAAPGTFTIAGADGTLYITSSPDLPGVNLETKNGVQQTLYTQPLLKNGTKVEQDDITGKVVDITTVKKYEGVVNHVHVEHFTYKYDGYVKDYTGKIDFGRIKFDVKDSNQILFPNNPNPFGVTPVNDFIQKQQEKLRLLYEQQNKK